MDLDASKLKSPLLQQRRRVLKQYVEGELQMIRNKIILASNLGVSEIYYQVHPSFRYPDPSVPQENIVKELRQKNFRVTPLPGNVIKIVWGETLLESQEEPSSNSSRSSSKTPSAPSKGSVDTAFDKYPKGWNQKKFESSSSDRKGDYRY